MCPACRMCVCLQLLVLFHLVVVTDCQAVSITASGCINTATCPCCKPGTCPPDGSGKCGGSNCLDGYHGPKCWNRCPPTCVSCVDAPQGDGIATCTQCKEGYYSTTTQYQCQLSCPSACRTCASSTRCTSCRDGYHMTALNQCVRCTDSCSTCTSAGACTGCKNGYFLNEDTGQCTRCSPLCFTCSSPNVCICSNGCYRHLCDHSNGICHFSCEENFKYGHSDKCDTCKNGMYGYQCNTSCSENCDLTCDRISGVCTACKQGFHGDYCNESCPDNCLSSCNRTTGYCFTCKEGYHGIDCTLDCQRNCRYCSITNGTCTTCVDGYYGNLCDKNCSENCLINKCNKINGSCECFPGYGGDNCQQKITTSTTPRFPRDGLPLVVTPTPENYAGEAIGITLAGVVVLAGVIGGAIVMYRRRKRTLLTESLPVMSFKARTSDEAKLKAELGSLRGEIATFDTKAAAARERQAEVEAQLQELDRQMPYRHTDRADVITEENAYEMLQRQKHEEQGHYTSIKY